MVFSQQSRTAVRNPYIRKRSRTEIENPNHQSAAANALVSKSTKFPIHNDSIHSMNQSQQSADSALDDRTSTLNFNSIVESGIVNTRAYTSQTMNADVVGNGNGLKQQQHQQQPYTNNNMSKSSSSTSKVEQKTFMNPYTKKASNQQLNECNQVKNDTSQVYPLPSNQNLNTNFTSKTNSSHTWEDDTTLDWDAAFLQMEKNVNVMPNITNVICKTRDAKESTDNNGNEIYQRTQQKTGAESENSNRKGVDYSGTAQSVLMESRNGETLRPMHEVQAQKPPMPQSGSTSMLSKHIATKFSNNGKPKPSSNKAYSKLAGVMIGNDSQLRNMPSKAAPLPKLDRPASWGTTPAPQHNTTISSRPGSSNENTMQTQNNSNRKNENVIKSASGITLPQLPPELAYASDRIHFVVDEHRQSLVKHANLSSPLLNGWSLFSHQKKAILRGLLMRRIILALDMGLGKTLIGCVWARAFKRTFPTIKAFVICPVSLKKEWKRTAEDATGLDVEDEKQGEKVASDDPNKMKICSWAKIPKVPTGVNEFIVICDEAHSMQSMTSTRTKDVLQLVLSPKCLGVLLLTGTPMKNGKPSNLFPLLKAVRHPFGERQKPFEVQFCAGQEKNYGRGRVWDANGSSNLPCLRAHVASHLLYMTKEECLKDLPPRTRTVQKVPVSSRHQIRHDTALNDLARLYENSDKFDSSHDVILGAFQRVRQIASVAKVDATVGLANKVLKEEPAVVIFTSFCQAAKFVHKQLSELGWNGELLTGETPAQKRQAMVDNFQSGLSSVFVCTFGAGGVGLTLTAAHTIILLDRPWTPGDAAQAEDRVRRIGQTKPVRSIWMVAFDLDTQIDAVIQQKQQNSNAVLVEGSENNGANAAPPKISISQLLKRVLPKVNANVNSTKTDKPSESNKVILNLM